MLPFGLMDHPEFLVGQIHGKAGVADGNHGFEIGLCEIVLTLFAIGARPPETGPRQIIVSRIRPLFRI